MTTEPKTEDREMQTRARQVVFYKSLPIKDVFPGFIPGTVTTSWKEAVMWWERYNSARKRPRGAERHIPRQSACIVSFSYPAASLLPASEFQRPGVREHARRNCWTSQSMDKAQINTPVSVYEIVHEPPGAALAAFLATPPAAPASPRKKTF